LGWSTRAELSLVGDRKLKEPPVAACCRATDWPSGVLDGDLGPRLAVGVLGLEEVAVTMLSSAGNGAAWLSARC
jgi:hypothetical protein